MANYDEEEVGGVTGEESDWIMKHTNAHTEQVRDSDVTRTADVPLVNSSLVTDRDSERITIYGQYEEEGTGGGAITYIPQSFLLCLIRYW